MKPPDHLLEQIVAQPPFAAAQSCASGGRAPGIRPQYHLRQTKNGIDAWDVHRLVELGSKLTVKMIDPLSVAELHENHWYFHDPNQVPTPSSVLEHLKLISASDLAYPIILDSAGRVMDGMHRVCKAILENENRIAAVQFETDPAPDYVGCDPGTLPYET